MQMDVASDNLAQVDNSMQRGCDLVQVDNNFILRKDSRDCDIAQVDYYCYNDTHSSVSDESIGSSVAQVENIINSPMASDGVVQVVNNSYITLPCDLVQVENFINESNSSSIVQVDNCIKAQSAVCDVVQVGNIYNTLSCDVVQVGNIFSTLSCDVDQVENIAYKSAIAPGTSVVQVENLYCEATAHGLDLDQVDNLLYSAHAQGESVAQVVNCNYSEAHTVGGELVQVGDLYTPTNSQRECLLKVNSSRGVKCKRSYRE